MKTGICRGASGVRVLLSEEVSLLSSPDNAGMGHIHFGKNRG